MFVYIKQITGVPECGRAHHYGINTEREPHKQWGNKGIQQESFTGKGQKKTATNKRISTWVETLLRACPRKISLGGLHWTLTWGPHPASTSLQCWEAGLHRLHQWALVSCGFQSHWIKYRREERVWAVPPTFFSQGRGDRGLCHLTCLSCRTLHEALSTNELQKQLFASSGCRIFVYTV